MSPSRRPPVPGTVPYMKKFIGKLIAILSILLTLLIILVGAYIGVPSFKSRVNSLIPADGGGVKVKLVNPAGTKSAPDPASGSVITMDTPGNDAAMPAFPAADPAAAPAPMTPPDQAAYPETPGEPAAEPAATPIPEPNISDCALFLVPDVDTRYVSPSETDLDIPDGMLARLGGYEPVLPDLKTVPDMVADELESTLDYGNTGDGLDFDPLMYPYYHMLDDKSKHLYRQIYANALDLYDDFKAVETDVTPAQVKNAFMAVFNDHPELFYMDTKFSAAFRGSGDCLELKLYFNDLADNIDQTRAEFEEAAAAVRSSASGSPYELEKAAHDALSQMNTYSLASPHNQSAYSALKQGSTVCAGYSRAMQYIMQQAGIPCYYCSGYAGENHAWNIICLDGEYYNLDVTWDDTDDQSVVNYDWFNKTDADYGTTHIRRDLSVYLPPCNGTKYRTPDPVNEGGPDNNGITAFSIQIYP